MGEITQIVNPTAKMDLKSEILWAVRKELSKSKDRAINSIQLSVAAFNELSKDPDYGDEVKNNNVFFGMQVNINKGVDRFEVRAFDL